MFLFSIITMANQKLLASAYSFSTNSGIAETANWVGVNTTATLPARIKMIIQPVLALLGVIFLGLMIYGGIMWMTAEGADDKVVKARKIIDSAIIGLVITLAAYAISYFVVSAFANQAFKTV